MINGLPRPLLLQSCDKYDAFISSTTQDKENTLSMSQSSLQFNRAFYLRKDHGLSFPQSNFDCDYKTGEETDVAIPTITHDGRDLFSPMSLNSKLEGVPYSATFSITPPRQASFDERSKSRSPTEVIPPMPPHVVSFNRSPKEPDECPEPHPSQRLKSYIIDQKAIQSKRVTRVSEQPKERLKSYSIKQNTIQRKRATRISPTSGTSLNFQSNGIPKAERGTEQPACEKDVTVFIGNLPCSVSEKEIMQSFRLWGFPPLRARIRDASSGKQECKYAFVDLPNVEMAEGMVRKFNRKKLFGSDCVRVEIEKRHAVHQNVREDPSHKDRIQSLLKGKGWVSLPEIFILYQQSFGEQLRVLDDTHLLKLLVKCDNLLILNAKANHDLKKNKRQKTIVWVYATSAPTFNTVVKILKRPQSVNGLPMTEFQRLLEMKFGFRRGELNRFDLDSFLRRWRVVQIQEGKVKTVKLSPSNLHTVFLGCLGQNISSKEVSTELTKIGFPNVPIRMKHGNGNTMAFVDVPSYKDAQKLVDFFHGKRLLGGTNIRAEIEKSCIFRNRAGKRPDSKSGRVYALLNEAKGKVRLSHLIRRYKNRYGQSLSRTNNSLRTLIQMDQVLLFNTRDPMNQDIYIVHTPELGPKIVRNICACFPEGLSIDQFQLQLEGRLGQKLNDCDIRSFLTRWRFLELRNRPGKSPNPLVFLKLSRKD